MIGRTVRDILTRATHQYVAQIALSETVGSSVLMTAMDLSAEAEAFGATIRMDDNEVPAVTGRLVTSAQEIESLSLPAPGTGRTRVYLETAHRLSGEHGTPLVLGGMIGPFSLAGRLFGVSEALEATMTGPETMVALLEKTTSFLVMYARAFCALEQMQL